ncbi:MAG: hypothetical protein M3355_00430, partial [Actinomycetota bacterium]|nr:hypothetical protein [Actinomycetota bacterium]
PYAREAAAIVACRPRALLRRRTAAGLWRLPIGAPGEIEVLVAGRHRRSLEGVRVASIDHLAPTELRRIEGTRMAYLAGKAVGT